MVRCTVPRSFYTGNCQESRASLPKIDCGACGSPTCMAFAEDVVKGYAELSACVVGAARAAH